LIGCHKRLLERVDLGRDDVFKVDVEGFSSPDPEHTDKVMEVLNNVQLEGRINVEISKNDGMEDVIITEEVLVVVWWRQFWQEEEGSFAPRREGSGGGFKSTETQLQERGLERRSSAPREGGLEEETDQEEGSSDRAPRRSESFGDSPRPRNNQETNIC
jgi:ATP-dependent RNA helicase DeaD